MSRRASSEAGFGGITQRQWRAAGAMSLLASLVMALYAVVSGFLEASVWRAVSLFNESAAGRAPDVMPVWVHLAFWAVFFALIGLTLYLAFVDMRYIRLQYMMERRAIFGRTLGDKEFRESLLRPSGTAKNPSNN